MGRWSPTETPWILSMFDYDLIFYLCTFRILLTLPHFSWSPYSIMALHIHHNPQFKKLVWDQGPTICHLFCFNILFLMMCVRLYGSICTCECRYLGRPERGIKYLETTVTGHCGTPNIGAGNQTQGICKRKKKHY